MSLKQVTYLIYFIVMTVVLLMTVAFTAQADFTIKQEKDSLWVPVNETKLRPASSRLIIPDQYQIFSTDVGTLTQLLSQAPVAESGAPLPDAALTLPLPLPNGMTAQFYVFESPIMEPKLASKFPQIKTYVVYGVNNRSAVGRLDMTPHGFHAMIFSDQGALFIDPYRRDDTIHYISYFKDDFSRNAADFVEYGPFSHGNQTEVLPDLVPNVLQSSGPELRTYRLAVAATGEYTQFHGGTIPDAMAEIVTAVNRVNGIYEREVALTMVLVANNDLIVYTNGATDPYTNNNGVTMLGQNQTNLDSVIGNANYDIGHVFSTGGGGVASLGVPCRTGAKARGVTGLSSPIGDPFYVDYVAHEMGHQWNAGHTFNGNAGSCSGSNRNGSTAYEPGSGTTIMAYAGICSSQNIQSNSDDYFHTISFDEIIAYSTLGSGNTCAVVTNTSNNPPVVNAGTGGFTIPKQTPFTLTGSASDPDGDTLSYMWEEFDLGPAGHPNAPVDNAPIFRSFSAMSEPSRTFPQISDIVNNAQTIGEILPSYGRSLNFRFIARDNKIAPSAGGVAYDLLSFSVSDTAGPFLVTQPNMAVTWVGLSQENVTWDIANTDNAPINCTAVDIHLSTDGGYTYPHTLITNTPNDGSEMIAVPNTPTTTARVQVTCANNIFFDISNTNFSIVAGVPAASLALEKSVQSVTPLQAGDPLTYTITVTNSGNLTATAIITDHFPIGLEMPACEGQPAGDLLVTTSVSPFDSVSFTCTADAAPSLAVSMTKSVDQLQVQSETAVTYTLTITNPSAILTLTNVIVDDPGVHGCTPALGTPVTLEPLTSQVYSCPENIVTTTISNTAFVTATASLTNEAFVSAPEDANGVISAEVTNEVTLVAQDTAVVTVNEYLFLPVIAKP